MMYRNLLPTALALLAIAGCGREKNAGTVGTNPDVEAKVELMLSQMTLAEKIGQMNQISVAGDPSAFEGEIKAGLIGSILNETDPDKINQYQRYAVEGSRLGIPLLVARDIIHGFHTIFPIPLGQAATFDPDIAETGARVSALEGTACGIRWTFSPMLDVARDPRWGRMAEGAGEDTYLTTVMGAAMIRGYQDAPIPMAACAKHFVGYGASEGGRDYGYTAIPERQLRNVYLPPFEEAIRSGALTVMTSFNDNDGVPSTGNRELVSGILRGEWGFDGLVVTDWNSMGEMIPHGFGADYEEIALKSIRAGVDMDMMTYGYLSSLEKLLGKGDIDMSMIDNAVRNILRVKYLLGLFDSPYVDVDDAAKAQYTAENLAAAQKAAEESAILLKNDGVLPLDASRKLRILVTGPLADAPYDQMGTWCFDGEKAHTVTPLKSLSERAQVVYVPSVEYSRQTVGDFSKVVAAARNADVIIAFLGEEAILSGEAHCLSDLNLQGSQSRLLEVLHQSGKPVVCVIMAGRPLTIERDLPNCNAMLYAFHPGTMGGPALANILFGDVNPSGRTPVTFLRTVGQVPMYYAHNNTGRPYNGSPMLDEIPLEAGQTSLGNTSYYLDSGAYPLFPFGYGLSYTSFEYTAPVLEKEEYAPGEVIRASVTIRNTGDVAGVETAQLYVRDLVGSITRPVRELKGFRRVELASGQETTVSFELPVKDLEFWGITRHKALEAGGYRLWISHDSASGESVEFSVKTSGESR